MKEIVVQNQVRLGPGRILALTVSGMVYRLFRSSITVVILVLAVTFLAHVLTHSLIEHRTRVLAYEELRDARLLGAWVNRLTEPASPQTIIANLADREQPRLAEYRRWTGREDLPVETAADLMSLHDYLNGLPESKRIVVTAGLETDEAIRRLNNAEEMDTFIDRLQRNRLRMPMGDPQALRQLMLQRVPQLRQFVEQVRQAHAKAISEVRFAMGGQPPQQWMPQMPDRALNVLSTAGFTIEQQHLDRLATQAIRAEKMSRLSRALDVDAIATALVREMDVDRTEVNIDSVLGFAASRSRAEWLSGQLSEHAPQADLPADQLVSLAEAYKRQRKLEAAVGDSVPRQTTGVFDLPGQTRWLVALSFLVCAVGVTNAMFMSVSERFTEIATMKCLGALDGFLMVMFLFESSIQGLVGAVLGIALGVLLAALRGLVQFGLLSLEAFPWAELITASFWSLLAGLLLAVLAAVGPAWMAARLVPMEAMRID